LSAAGIAGNPGGTRLLTTRPGDVKVTVDLTK
jgi:hypothetical protein